MFRLVLSNIPAKSRFKRFWVPSLSDIERASKGIASGGSSISIDEERRIGRLIRHVRVGNTNKSTAPARLREADLALATCLKSSPKHTLRFLDVGCSDGTTSLDTIDVIESQTSAKVAAFLVDRYMWIQRRNAFPLVEYVTTESDLVMLTFGRLAITPVPESFVLAPLVRRVLAWYTGKKQFRRRFRKVSTIPLISPRVLIREEVEIHEGSVLVSEERFQASMDIVRISNLLHKDYFSESDIVAGINIARGYLKEDGLLLISKNHLEDGREVERGSIWRLAGKNFLREAEFGGGSEIRDLVDSVSKGG